MANRAHPRGARDRAKGHAEDRSVSLTEAAAMLGVGDDVLLEALVEHGLSETEARRARLLSTELDTFRRRLHGVSPRARADLSALRDLLEDG